VTLGKVDLPRGGARTICGPTGCFIDPFRRVSPWRGRKAVSSALRSKYVIKAAQTRACATRRRRRPSPWCWRRLRARRPRAAAAPAWIARGIAAGAGCSDGYDFRPFLRQMHVLSPWNSAQPLEDGRRRSSQAEASGWWELLRRCYWPGAVRVSDPILSGIIVGRATT
jgi:hypothetical protein